MVSMSLWRVVAVVAVLTLAGCGTKVVTAADQKGPKAAAGWQVHPRAFASTDARRSGPRALVALDGGCFVGVGMDNTGYGGARATWTAAGRCVHPRWSGHTAGQAENHAPHSYDEAQIVDAAQGGDGRLVAVSRYVYHNDFYGYDSAFLIGRPGASWRTTRRVEAPRIPTSQPVHGSTLHVGPAAVTALPSGGYVAVGRRDTNGEFAVVWTSATGKKWAESRLPMPDEQVGASATEVAAAPDGTLVAVGESEGQDYDEQVALAWRSTDGGRHWRAVHLPGGTGVQVHAVVATTDGFTILGGHGTSGKRAAVFDSTTGRTLVGGPGRGQGGGAHVQRRDGAARWRPARHRRQRGLGGARR